MTAVAGLSIRYGAVADAEPLSRFMAFAFTTAFGALNQPEHLAAFLASTYTTEQQAAELTSDAMTTLIAEQDGRLAGYAQLRQSDYLPPGVTGPAPIEVYRFYVDPALIGRGVARPLMERTMAEARRRGARTLWLGVWEVNSRGIAFYRKMGFTEVGRHTFTVGGDPQVDLVMCTSLESS